MAQRRSLVEKQIEHDDLKRRAHLKVEELTIHQLRKFLAAYVNPGGWNKHESESQIAAIGAVK